jgi:hypothetical protein
MMQLSAVPAIINSISKVIIDAGDGEMKSANSDFSRAVDLQQRQD